MQGCRVFELLLGHHETVAENGGAWALRGDHTGPRFFEQTEEHNIIHMIEGIAIAPAKLNVDNPFL
jgi:hypothetical protein